MSSVQQWDIKGRVRLRQTQNMLEQQYREAAWFLQLQGKKTLQMKSKHVGFIGEFMKSKAN